MAWALVATADYPGTEYNYETGAWEAVTWPPNTIVNLIVYDGSAEFTPPADTVLLEVPDDAAIGDSFVDGVLVKAPAKPPATT